MAKVSIMVTGGDIPICDDKNVAPFSNVIKSGVNDTISHVMLTAFNVLQDCVNAWSEGGLQRNQLGALDSALMTVLGKFGDANAKVRGEASSTLSFCAGSDASSLA